jgi:hypothetical protein
MRPGRLDLDQSCRREAHGDERRLGGALASTRRHASRARRRRARIRQSMRLISTLGDDSFWANSGASSDRQRARSRRALSQKANRPCARRLVPDVDARLPLNACARARSPRRRAAVRQGSAALGIGELPAAAGKGSTARELDRARGTVAGRSRGKIAMREPRRDPSQRGRRSPGPGPGPGPAGGRTPSAPVKPQERSAPPQSPLTDQAMLNGKDAVFAGMPSNMTNSPACAILSCSHTWRSAYSSPPNTTITLS